MNIDNALFKFINHLPHPFWADQVILLLDSAGEKEIILTISGILFLLGLLLRERKVWLGAIFLCSTVLLTGFVVGFMKNYFNRPRPFAIFEDVYLIGDTKGASFTSGHAGLYAALGAFMIFYFKKAKILWAVLIFLGGAARIYQGAHYPSDVLVSWIIAVFFARVMAWGCENLDKLRKA